MLPSRRVEGVVVEASFRFFWTVSPQLPPGAAPFEPFPTTIRFFLRGIVLTIKVEAIWRNEWLVISAATPVTGLLMTHYDLAHGRSMCFELLQNLRVPDLFACCTAILTSSLVTISTTSPYRRVDPVRLHDLNTAWTPPGSPIIT